MNAATNHERTFAGHTAGTWITKVVVYSIGMFLVALGVSVSIKSNLGVTPLNALPYVLSVVIKKNMGLIVMFVFSVYVVLQILILHRRFKLINLLQFLVSIMFGFFVGVCNKFTASLVPVSYVMQLVFMVCGIIILAFGVAVYMASGIVPLSAEGFVKALQEVTGRPFHRLKMAFDCTLVTLALGTGFFAGGGIIGVREGTVIAAVCVGPTIGIVTRFIGRPLRQLCGERQL